MYDSIILYEFMKWKQNPINSRATTCEFSIYNVFTILVYRK